MHYFVTAQSLLPYQVKIANNGSYLESKSPSLLIHYINQEEDTCQIPGYVRKNTDIKELRRIAHEDIDSLFDAYEKDCLIINEIQNPQG